MAAIGWPPLTKRWQKRVSEMQPDSEPHKKSDKKRKKQNTEKETKEERKERGCRGRQILPKSVSRPSRRSLTSCRASSRARA